MAKISYEFYSDEAHAAQIARLMVRNKFGMGKFNPQLKAEDVARYQAEKGFVFGLVGVVDEEVVCYTACYQLGAQRVANPKQIIIGVILIDKGYRTAVFSISEMFSLLLKKVSALGYLEMLTEVAPTNTMSMLMMKKTGFVFFEDTKTPYHELVLHNYTPAIVKLLDTTLIVDEDIIPRFMAPSSRQKLLEKTQLDAAGCFVINLKDSVRDYAFRIDTVHSVVVGARIKGLLDIQQDPIQRNRFTLDMLKDFNDNAKIYFCKGADIQATKTIPYRLGHTEKIVAPTGCNCVKFQIPGEQCMFSFDVFERKRTREKENVFHNAFQFHEKSGYTDCLSHDGKPLLCEMWPCFTYPYLEGVMAPNYDKELKAKTVGRKQLIANALQDGVSVERRYDASRPGELTIRTIAKSDKPLLPLFHLGLLDHSFRCNICLEDGEEVQRKYREDDFMYGELAFEDFSREDYSRKQVREIQLRFGEDEFVITADRPLRCFQHRNYIRLLIDGVECDGGYDYGAIHIQTKKR